MKSFVFSLFFVLLIGGLFPGQAYAHKVIIFAWVDGNLVHTQSKFSGGRKVAKGLVEARDESGILVSKGETSEQGEYSFKLEEPRVLHIVLKAGMGHRAEWTLNREDFGEPPMLSSPPTEDLSNAISLQNQDNLQEIVEEVLDRKLQPIHRMLAEQKEDKISFKDILGGIGYIIGLVGLAAYIRYRKT
jgi:nickel transport protein